MEDAHHDGSHGQRPRTQDSFPSVFIIIVNWNGKDVILECLDSLTGQHYPRDKYRILVIDNASSDGSQAAIRERYPGAALVENRSNLGYVKAVNQGIEQGLKSDASYMWILNNDVVVDKDALNRLVAIGEQEQESGVLAPVIYSYSEPEKIENAGYAINYWTGRLKKINLSVGIAPSPSSRMIHVDSNMGCSNLIKTSVFKRIGRFNPIYDVYFEETDFNVRAGKSGYRVTLVSDAKVWHRTASTMNQFLLRRAFLLLRNLFIFEFLHAKLYHLLVFIPYYFFIHIPYFFLYGSIYAVKIRLKSLKKRESS